MFSSICKVLETLIDNGSNFEQKYEARVVINSIQSFAFIFSYASYETYLGNPKWFVSSIVEKISKYCEMNEFGQDL